MQRPLRAKPLGAHKPGLRRKQTRHFAMVVPVMPVSQALVLSGVLVGAGLLIFLAAALPRHKRREPTAQRGDGTPRSIGCGEP